MFLDREEFVKLSRTLKELHKACQTDTGTCLLPFFFSFSSSYAWYNGEIEHGVDLRQEK